MTEPSRRQFLGAAAALSTTPLLDTGVVELAKESYADVYDPRPSGRPESDPRPFPLVIEPDEPPYDFKPTEVDIYPSFPDGEHMWMAIHGDWGDVSVKLDSEAAAWIHHHLGRVMEDTFDD